ncbi:MAG: isochorismatase family cysteine hydrolase [Actinomycetota bacterium]
MRDATPRRIEAKDTAVVLVEFQRQWTDRGLFNRLIRTQLEPRSVIENTRRLVAAARTLGVTVIHAPLVIDPQSKKGWMTYPTFGRLFTKGTWRSELVPGVYGKGDPIAERGHYNLQAFDAFHNSELDDILRRRGIHNVFVCGFATDQCPSRTMRTANRRGFDAFLVSDCTATFTRLLQRRAENRDGGTRSVTSQELLTLLGAETPAPTSQ